MLTLNTAIAIALRVEGRWLDAAVEVNIPAIANAHLHLGIPNRSVAAEGYCRYLHAGTIVDGRTLVKVQAPLSCTPSQESGPIQVQNFGASKPDSKAMSSMCP